MSAENVLSVVVEMTCRISKNQWKVLPSLYFLQCSHLPLTHSDKGAVRSFQLGLNMHVFGLERTPEYLETNHTDSRRTCKLYTERQSWSQCSLWPFWSSFLFIYKCSPEPDLVCQWMEDGDKATITLDRINMAFTTFLYHSLNINMVISYKRYKGFYTLNRSDMK